MSTWIACCDSNRMSEYVGHYCYLLEYTHYIRLVTYNYTHNTSVTLVMYRYTHATPVTSIRTPLQRQYTVCYSIILYITSNTYFSRVLSRCHYLYLIFICTRHARHHTFCNFYFYIAYLPLLC